jgi:NADH-quinone oxidoreductase subunit M
MVLAAVYMLWIFQRVMTGPVRGAAVLAEDDEGGQPVPVAVGAPAHTDPDGHEMTHPEPHTTTTVRARFGDLKPREIAVVTPLVLLILFLGVYPKPVLDVINPTSAQTMTESGHTDPAPALGGGK